MNMDRNEWKVKGKVKVKMYKIRKNKTTRRQMKEKKNNKFRMRIEKSR